MHNVLRPTRICVPGLYMLILDEESGNEGEAKQQTKKERKNRCEFLL